ncbi:hypothetical protein ATANTOWER_027870 [Ataeniobius toweri]|uniref:Uncharacterized protein n=1 Tax=Ataeniobius toweri TaxID=208326 RepID=A0ABU7C461_9TELE|nr:hypothetical protein [Ataeniobius toweri]
MPQNTNAMNRLPTETQPHRRALPRKTPPQPLPTEHCAHNGPPRPLKSGQSQPTSSPWPAARTWVQWSPQCPSNHRNTPHNCHWNDSQGRNTNQHSFTVTTQLIQMANASKPQAAHP